MENLQICGAVSKIHGGYGVHIIRNFPTGPALGKKPRRPLLNRNALNAKYLARTLGHKGAAVQIFRMNAHSPCGWMNRQFRTVSSQRTCAVCALHPKRIFPCRFPSRRAHFCVAVLSAIPSSAASLSFSSVSPCSPFGEGHLPCTTALPTAPSSSASPCDSYIFLQCFAPLSILGEPSPFI